MAKLSRGTRRFGCPLQHRLCHLMLLCGDLHISADLRWQRIWKHGGRRWWDCQPCNHDFRCSARDDLGITVSYRKALTPLRRIWQLLSSTFLAQYSVRNRHQTCRCKTRAVREYDARRRRGRNLCELQWIAQTGSRVNSRRSKPVIGNSVKLPI
jgi:hypothetical protein